jgi:hypothetical protein
MEILQLLSLSTQTERIAKDISERNSVEIQKAILAKNME